MKIALNQDYRPKPSMTPVIDVVFNLLVFFLLASQFARLERDQDIQVPQVSYVPALTALPSSLIVNVSETGRYTVLANEYDLNGLDTLIGPFNLDYEDSYGILVEGPMVVTYGDDLQFGQVKLGLRAGTGPAVAPVATPPPSI